MKRLINIFSFAMISTLSFAQDVFTAAQLQSDAKLLWEALNELHPGLYRHTDTLALTKAYESLLQEFSSEKNEVEAFLELSSFISKIKCGHTYLNPFNQRNKIISSTLEEKVLLPFTFSIIDSKIIVENSMDASITRYDVITHINDLEVKTIIDNICQFIKADGQRKRKKIKDLEVSMTSEFEYFDFYFAMVYKFKEQVSLRKSDGSSLKINLLSKNDRDSKFSKKFPEAAQIDYEDLWSYEFFDDHAYLRLGTFVIWKFSMDWEKYLDDFFIELERRGIQNLIIDVRANEGGMTEVTNYLVKKLAKTEGVTTFRKPHLAYKKLSENIKPHVYTWSKWFNNTSIWTKRFGDHHRTIRFSSNKQKKIKKNPKAYQGQSYMLIDEANSSATFILAEIIKDNQYSILVGTDTGGTKKGITGGQMFFLNLPNTKIEIDIPLIGRYPLSELPDEGIKPDFTVETTLSGYLDNQDEQLEKVLELIKGN